MLIAAVIPTNSVTMVSQLTMRKIKKGKPAPE